MHFISTLSVALCLIVVYVILSNYKNTYKYIIYTHTYERIQGNYNINNDNICYVNGVIHQH